MSKKMYALLFWVVFATDMQVPWDVQIVMDHITSNLRLHEKSTPNSLQKEFDTYGTEWKNPEINFMKSAELGVSVFV